MPRMTDDELRREFPDYPLATARKMEEDRRKGRDGGERQWKAAQAASERSRKEYNRKYDLDDNGRPLKKGATTTTPSSFRHLRKASTAVPVTRADDSDDDDQAQVPTIPCDMCDATGSYGGKDCPGCDGEGALTPSKMEDRNKDFVDQFTASQAAARKPVGLTPPKPGSFAAQVIAAGKAARGGR